MLAKLCHSFCKIKVSAQGRLQQNGESTRHFKMPNFGLSPASSLIDKKNVGMDFKSKADGLAFSGPQLRRQAGV
jgi:hypothetical protein